MIRRLFARVADAFNRCRRRTLPHEYRGQTRSVLDRKIIEFIGGPLDGHTELLRPSAILAANSTLVVEVEPRQRFNVGANRVGQAFKPRTACYRLGWKNDEPRFLYVRSIAGRAAV